MAPAIRALSLLSIKKTQDTNDQSLPLPTKLKPLLKSKINACAPKPLSLDLTVPLTLAPILHQLHSELATLPLAPLWRTGPALSKANPITMATQPQSQGHMTYLTTMPIPTA